MERQIISVDISPRKGIIPQLRVSQGDIGRPLGVYIMQDGAALDCSSYTADLYVLKADGNYFVTHATIDSTTNNLVTWETAEQETPVAGECAAQIRIMSGADDIGTARFVEYVEASPGFCGAGSESAVESLEEYVRQAAESATTASAAATTATGAAASASSDAQTASGAATTATGAAETATAAAETAQEVLDSIPEDYSEMSEDVIALKTAITQKAPVIIGTASGTLATFPDGADGMPIRSLVVHLEPVQSGSGDPSPDNVRPITGHSGTVNVYRAGINIWDEQWELGKINSSGANISSDSDIRSVNYIPVLPGTEYYILIPATSGLRFYDKGKVYKSSQAIASSRNITIPDGCYYLRFYTGVTTFSKDISINYPATETEYHPGTVATYPITLPTGTFYGGTLDPVNGTLIVDRAKFTLTGAESWQKAGAYANTYYVARTAFDIANDNTGLVCNQYAPQASIGVDGGVRIGNSGIMFTDSRYATKEAFAEYIAGLYTAQTPVEFVALLSTPLTYTLTPTEITTLLGQNNVWSDAGAVSVEYPADTKLYIDRGQSEDDMTANATIGKGQYFQIGTAVYLATDTILTGEQIIPGSNAEQTTTAEALNQLISRQGGMWELIKSETFINATAGAHDITTDDNNQPFELTDVRIMIALPKQDTASAVASYGQIRAYYDNTHYDRVQVGAVSMNAQDALKCSQCEILQQDGMIVRNGGTFNTAGNRWGFTFSNEATQSTSSHWQLCDPKRVYNRIYVESVTGTCTIQVFGKRKL